MKADVALLLLACVTLWGCCSSMLGYDSDYESPEDDGTSLILETLADNMDGVMSFFLDSLDLGEDLEFDFLDDRIMSTFSQTNDTSNKCTSCTRTLTFLMGLVSNGKTFEDLRNISVEVCKVLVSDPDVNWDGDLLCEPIIDNYGPHLIYVLNQTEHTAEESCVLLNECRPFSEDDESHLALPSLVKPGRESQQLAEPKTRRNVTLEDAIKVIHVTDIHVEPEYDVGAASICNMPFCCRDEWEGTGSAGLWATYACNIPVWTADLFMEFLAGLGAHYLMYTGDSPPSTPWLETQEHQLNMSRLIASLIGDYFPDVLSYSTIGNHESYPTNLYYMERPEIQELNSVWGELWGSLGALDEDQLANIRTGGFYTKVLQPGLRVMGYNSNFQATSNWYVLLDQENNGYATMRQFMEDTFNTARANGEKMILLTHHVTGAGGTVREHSEFITDICRRNADLIVLHLMGHSHRDKFHMNTDPETGAVYDVQFSSASMSSAPEMNPTARVFYLHPDTYDVMEADTFFLNLQNPTNNGSSPVIELAYRATVEYGLEDFTPQSIKAMVDRMETDEALVSQYLYNYDTRTGFNDVSCDEECTADLLCDLRTTSYNQRQECKDNIDLSL